MEQIFFFFCFENPWSEIQNVILFFGTSQSCFDLDQMRKILLFKYTSSKLIWYYHISRHCLLGWMIIRVLLTQVRMNVIWILDAGCFLQQIACIPFQSCLRRKIILGRYDKEKRYISGYSSGVINHLTFWKMMQEYDTTVKLLSDFEILNQVSLLASCLKFLG